MTGAEEDTTLKRLRMRSWRRGMKEMDLILGQYADAELARLAPDEIAVYERLLSENDQELYAWVTGAEPTPPDYGAIIRRVRDHHAIE
jgi:antitoxin CptB